MKKLCSIARAATSMGVAALTLQTLAGCSGGSPSIPGSAGAPNAARAHKSWVSREAATVSQLLYVADSKAATVNIYAWPALKPLGIIVGFNYPSGMCVDKKGDVYIADFYGLVIYEYPRGGVEPIETLMDNYGEPSGCSVDPKTGNLAVASIGNGSGAESLLVFPPRVGTPNVYQTPGIIDAFFPAYDDRGNLFVDGFTESGNYLDELPYGGSTVEPISLNEPIGEAGGLQWDGKYLAIADQTSNTIYQLVISGSTGEAVSATQLSGAQDIFQFWVTGGTQRVQGNQVVAASPAGGSAPVWNYPAGGQSTEGIVGLNYPMGVVITGK